MKSAKRILCVVITAVMLILPFSIIDASAAGKWVATWASSMVNGSVSVAGLQLNDIVPAGHTIRSALTVTASGTMLRFQFSNQYGNAPITINMATVAKTSGSGSSSIKTGSAVPITFNESSSVTIAAGDTVWSDSIDFKTNAMDNISVSLYFANMVYMKTAGLSNARTYLSLATGNQTGSPSLSNASEIKITSSTVTYHTAPFLSAIDTYSTDSNACSAVFIGDSTLVNNTYLYYAQRIVDAGVTNIGVVNQAIVGNRLLSNCTGNLIGNLFGDSLETRFKRDVLDMEGVKYCFVKIGLNDIIHQYSKSLGTNTPKYSTTDIINGYKRLITLCHQNGIKIYFFTKSAWNGYARAFLGQTDDLVWNSEAQAKCDELTNWIKTNSLADGYIDCSPLADPSDTTKLCSTLTLDGAHLSTTGSIALADLIPLSYVGVSGGRTCSAIYGVDPYAEKWQIIENMKNPTTATTISSAATVPATTSASSGGGSTATTKSSSSSTTAAAANGVIAGTTSGSSDTGTATTGSSAEEYTVTVPTGTITTGDYTVPAIVDGGAEAADPDAEQYTYNSQAVSYAVTDDSVDVDSIGMNGAIGFLLVMFMIIIIAGAVMAMNLNKKKKTAAA